MILTAPPPPPHLLANDPDLIDIDFSLPANKSLISVLCKEDISSGVWPTEDEL